MTFKETLVGEGCQKTFTASQPVVARKIFYLFLVEAFLKSRETMALATGIYFGNENPSSMLVAGAGFAPRSGYAAR